MAAGEFADAFAAALVRRHVTLTWLRDRLLESGHDVSLGALSYWRSGRREPARSSSLEALAEVEWLLGLRTGDLSSLLDPRRRRQGPSDWDEIAGLIERAAPGELVGEDVVRRVSMTGVVDIGADGCLVRIGLRQIFAAVVDDAEAVTMFVGPSVELGPSPLTLEAVAGCSIGRLRETSNGVRAAELVFERPLRAGESVMTEVELVPAAGVEETDTEYGLVAEQRLEECLLWVRFHPDRRPSRAWLRFSEKHLQHEWEVDLVEDTAIHHRLTSFGPGLLVARWDW